MVVLANLLLPYFLKKFESLILLELILPSEDCFPVTFIHPHHQSNIIKVSKID